MSIEQILGSKGPKKIPTSGLALLPQVLKPETWLLNPINTPAAPVVLFLGTNSEVLIVSVGSYTSQSRPPLLSGTWVFYCVLLVFQHSWTLSFALAIPSTECLKFSTVTSQNPTHPPQL